MLLPFSPLTRCFQSFLGVLHVSHSYCSLMPLHGAAGFALALQLTLQGLSFTVKGLKTTLLQKCLSRELLFVSVTTAINAWFTNLCQQSRNTFTWCQNYSYFSQHLLLNIHLILQNRNFSVHFSSYRLFFNLWHIGWMFELGDGK